MKSTIHSLFRTFGKLNYLKTKFLSKTKISFMLIFFFAILIGACKKDGSVEKTLSFEKTQYYPAELGQLNTTGISLTQTSYTATINDVSYTLIPYQNSLVLNIPNLSAGNYTVKLNLDGKEYNADFTLLSSPIIANPQTVIDAQISKLNSSVTDLQTVANTLSGTAKTNLLADATLIANMKTNLQAQYDTLSPTEKMNCALAIQANAWWVDEITTAIDSFTTNSSNLRLSLTGVEDYEKKVDKSIVNYLKPLFKLLIKDIPKIVAATAIGAGTGSVIPGIGTGIGATVGLGIAISNYLSDAQKLLAAEDKLFDAMMEPMNEVSTENLRITALSYTNNQQTALKIANNYRSTYKNDRSNPIPVVKDIIDFTDANDLLFQKVNSILPQQLSFDAPTIDDNLTYTKMSRDVHSNYITIGNISNNKVSVVVDKQDGNVLVTFKTTETTDQNFTYTVNYNNSRFGNYTQTVSAVLQPGDSTVTDIDGNVYHTVRIGTQVWMKENLKTTRYKDGSAIPTGLNDAAWQATTSGAYAIYDNNAANNTTYGKLYNWYAVNTGKLAPAGWHVPTDAEWTTLTTFLGGESVAGGAMKATTLWNSPNTGATNSSGFTGLPAGSRNSDGTFYVIGGYGLFWSSTEYGTDDAWYRYLYYNYSNAVSYYSNKRYGFSVRCVRD